MKGPAKGPMGAICAEAAGCLHVSANVSGVVRGGMLLPRFWNAIEWICGQEKCRDRDEHSEQALQCGGGCFGCRDDGAGGLGRGCGADAEFDGGYGSDDEAGEQEQSGHLCEDPYEDPRDQG
jgi:hypothetical protein